MSCRVAVIVWVLTAQLLVGCVLREFDEDSPLFAHDVATTDVEAPIDADDTGDISEDVDPGDVGGDSADAMDPCDGGCDDGNPCTVDQCDPVDGCVSSASANGTPCDDPDPCRLGGSCSGGICGGGVATCDDGVVCTVDTCTADGGCLHGTDDQACATGNLCVLRQCHPLQGCVDLALIDCDDGNACNGKETCDPLSGACKPGFSSGCPAEDGNVCNGIAVCNPETGGCEVLPPPVCPENCLGQWVCDQQLGCVPPDTGPCDDDNQNLCDGYKQCDAETGTCKVVALVCEQGELDLCVGIRQCDPDLGCVVVPSGKADCCGTDADCGDSPCFPAKCEAGVCQPQPAAVCDDDNVCNGQEICDGEMGCQPGTPLDCDDGNPCNGLTGCDPKTGCLPSAPVQCSDGNLCNGQESCDLQKGCQPGTPLQCDDGNLCDGLEVCDPEIGCKPAAFPLPCDDKNPCNGLEFCVPETGCEVGAAPLGGCCTAANECDDDNVCNGVFVCDTQTGTCEMQAAPPTCNDSDPCTADGCVPETGCVNLPVPGCTAP